MPKSMAGFWESGQKCQTWDWIEPTFRQRSYSVTIQHSPHLFCLLSFPFSKHPSSAGLWVSVHLRAGTGLSCYLRLCTSVLTPPLSQHYTPVSLFPFLPLTPSAQGTGALYFLKWWVFIWLWQYFHSWPTPWYNKQLLLQTLLSGVLRTRPGPSNLAEENNNPTLLYLYPSWTLQTFTPKIKMT